MPLNPNNFLQSQYGMSARNEGKTTGNFYKKQFGAIAKIGPPPILIGAVFYLRL